MVRKYPALYKQILYFVICLSLCMYESFEDEIQNTALKCLPGTKVQSQVYLNN